MEELQSEESDKNDCDNITSLKVENIMLRKLSKVLEDKNSLLSELLENTKNQTHESNKMFFLHNKHVLR